MVIGAIILLVGIVIGYFIPRYKIPLYETKALVELKKIFTNQKGIVVDLTPDIELPPIENDQEKNTVA